MTALPLDEHLQSVAATLAAPAHILVALDFDGTLTPIVLRPALADLAPEVRKALSGLARLPRVTLAVVSGRSLADVRERVGIEDIAYAGNHGLEIQGPGFSFLHPGAANTAADLEHVLDGIALALDGVTGVELEHKGLTASVHYRRVAPPDVLRVKLAVRRLVSEAPPTLLCREGKRVLEIRPAVHWHKGAAVSWIRDRIEQPTVACVYIGDDTTDEDAFQALAGGVTIRVGKPKETAARYRVPDTEGVHGFLGWLARELST